MNKPETTLASATMRREVLEGLKKEQKTLPSKYFYDERGSDLFEQITKLEEYYPTRSELEILKKYSGEMADLIGSNSLLIEFGSGSSEKVRYLLDQLQEIAGYVPVDISADFLKEQADRLRNEYPELPVYPIAADYTRPFEIDYEIAESKREIFFPGSTIGNFQPVRAKKFLLGSADLLGLNGGLLIGVDMKKDTDVLKRAYNDKQGITAKFNKNILLHINRELDAGFDTDLFKHHAFYNELEGRIEMHLISLQDHSVEVAGEKIDFLKDETIHTENSYKYNPDEFESLISERYKRIKTWIDAKGWFSVHYFEKYRE